MRINLRNEQLELHPHKAIYWEKHQMLLLADLHLGKATHFRRAGIPVPEQVGTINWDKLIGLLLQYEPKRVIFLGDLFHSTYNTKWEELEHLFQQFKGIQFELVLGNHDILPEHIYAKSLMKIHVELLVSPFLFTHHPLDIIPQEMYNICGHIHPCVYLNGQGQRVRLACYYFGKQQAILPAFGEFTGMAVIEVKRGDRVFVIAEDNVLEV